MNTLFRSKTILKILNFSVRSSKTAQTFNGTTTIEYPFRQMSTIEIVEPSSRKVIRYKRRGQNILRPCFDTYANKNGFRTAVLSRCSGSKHLRSFKSIIRPDTSSLRIESKSILCLNERCFSIWKTFFKNL